MNKCLSQITLLLFLLILGSGLFGGCNRKQRVEVQKAKIGDLELAYYIRGQGEPLVMIMGFRGTMSVWDPALLEELEKNYTLILFDNRGMGLSSDTAQDLTTIPNMAEDTFQLIQTLGFEKVHVLGWSMGSRIALDLAFKHPDLVSSLILCSPNPGGKFQAKRTSDAYQRLTALELSEKETLSLIFPDTEEGREASRAFVERLTKDVLEGYVPQDFKISLQGVQRQIHALKLWDENNHVYEDLPNLHVPTLVASGLNDVLDEPENARLVAGRIPFAWAAYFPRAGHYFASQDYQAFADLIKIFIETTKN